MLEISKNRCVFLVELGPNKAVLKNTFETKGYPEIVNTIIHNETLLLNLKLQELTAPDEYKKVIVAYLRMRGWTVKVLTPILETNCLGEMFLTYK